MQKRIPYYVAIIGLSAIFLNATINLDSLFNYANQSKPQYITKDNTPNNNAIDDKIATLGRVLFYDKKLSANNTVSCSSCHQQAFAFSDPLTTSDGLNGGKTGRHSMRLVNSRFAQEAKFFWDERATSLENQVTQPIQDHVEMGFSGSNGDPNFNDLIVKLSAVDYYQTLFNFAFGDVTITEERIQKALAQFVRSIQSFDSKFDAGLDANNGNINGNFNNFTTQENLGKRLFLDPPNLNGAGCAGCHRAPEFDIDPNSLNNGVITVANSTAIDLTNTRSPSLRDLVNPSGNLNGPLMHDGSFTSILQAIEHYNSIPNNAANTNLDQRLQRPGQNTQQLNLTNDEKLALEAFLKTLTGTDVYTNEKWSNPFDSNGNLTLSGSILSAKSNVFEQNVSIFPNPATDNINIKLANGNYQVYIFTISGKLQFKQQINGNQSIQIDDFAKGVYLIKIKDLDFQKEFNSKFVKQ